jgi:hypothetical protein
VSDLKLPPLGFPWDQYAEAVLRWDEANRRHHAAQVAGDVSAREEAALDRETALVDRQRIRDEVVRQWLLGFRWALEECPAAVASLLGDLPPAEPVVEALRELEDRVDTVEDAVVRLMTRRVG